MASSKGYRNSKKVDEVREVCQNKPEAEISKILEVFDNDVAKTINAFMTDGGKQALSDWASQKRNERKTPNKTEQTDNDSAKPKRQNNNNKTNKQTNNGTTNNSNINDLVSSIINQSINTTVPSDTPVESVKDTAVIEGGSLSSQVKQQQTILNSLNNLITNGHSKSFSALKVTVVGQEPEKQNIKQPVLPNKSCSISSSPSSMSTASVSSVSTTHSQNPSNLLPFHTLNNNLNMSYTNPNNTRANLDKHQKDLHRQSIHLAKIASQFQDDLNKAQIDCNQTFMFVRNILDERQQQLHAQLNSVGRQGNQILTERQHKASQLRTLVDNAAHLNDIDTSELKADIKHFVSERQIDEEFLKLKLFQQDSSDKLRETINNFSRIPKLDQIKYAVERPPTEQVLSNNHPMPKTQVGNGVQHLQKTVNQVKTTDKPVSNGTRHSVKITEVNGHGDEQNSDNDGGFIVVKKPQRNKNKQQQALNVIQTNGAHDNIVSVSATAKLSLNGDSTSSKSNGIPIINGTATNGVSKKKKQPKKKLPEMPIAKANMNPFSLIANGHIN